jgi:hypothetical protein
MRRLLGAGLLMAAAMSSTGCFYNMYSPDPIRRQRQLFNQSVDLMLLEDEVERFWQIDQHSNLSPYRYQGMAYGTPHARRLPLSREEKPGFENRFLK